MEYKDTNRQTGRTTKARTTKALLEASENAMYICPTAKTVRTIQHMAETLGRYDLCFLAATELQPNQLTGLHKNRIVVDHAAKLSREVLEVLASLRA